MIFPLLIRTIRNEMTHIATIEASPYPLSLGLEVTSVGFEVLLVAPKLSLSKSHVLIVSILGVFRTDIFFIIVFLIMDLLCLQGEGLHLRTSMAGDLGLGRVMQNLHGHKFIQDLVGGQVTEIRSLTNDLSEMLLIEKHSRDELSFDPIIIGVLASMIRHVIG